MFERVNREPWCAVTLLMVATLHASIAYAQEERPSRAEAAVLAALQAINWKDDVCRPSQCKVVLVDTAIYRTPTVQLVPARDTIALTLTPRTLSSLVVDSLAFVASPPYDLRAMVGDTAFIALGFSGPKTVDADSLLIVARIVPPGSKGWPEWVYASLRWTGREWRVERLWSVEG